MAYRTKSRWQEWLDSVHDGGRKKVPNPNPETAKRFPQVSFSSALKNDAFRAKAEEDFKKWSEENPKEERGKKKAPPKKEEPKEKHTKLTDIGLDGTQVGNVKVISRMSKPENVEKVFGSKAPSAETLVKMFGVPDPDVKGSFSIYTSGDKVEVNGSFVDKDGNSVATIQRSFKKEKGKLVVHHDLLKIQKNYKGKGTGTQILKNSFEEYKKMGVGMVEQDCAWDGQYVWPRMGYKMTPDALEESKQHLADTIAEKMKLVEPEQVAAVETWIQKNVKSGQDIADLHLPDGTPIGKEALLSGDMFSVTLDLKDGDPNYERMKKYLNGIKDRPQKKFDAPMEEKLSPGVDQDWGEQYKVALRYFRAMNQQTQDKSQEKPESDDLATELLDQLDSVEQEKKTLPEDLFNKTSQKLPRVALTQVAPSLSCSGCGRSRRQGNGPRLIKGGTIVLCEVCIQSFHDAFSSLPGNEEPKVKIEEERKGLPKPLELISHLDSYVIGQGKAKEALAVSLYQHYRMREFQGVIGDVEIEKSNVLIHGPSGTGKTLLIKTLARSLGVPCFVGDATRLTSAGYVGDDVESLLQGLIQDANGNLEKASWGIVVLDEIDKIRRFSGRGPAGYKDVSGESVQQALLKLMEGGKVTFPAKGKVGNNHITLDTKHVLFIFLGSFAGIEEVVETRVKKTSRMGFHSSGGTVGNSLDPLPTQEDFIEFGMIPEFMGRIPVRTLTHALTEDEICRALVEPKNSVLAQMVAIFRMEGVSLEFTPEALKAIVGKAYQDPTGVRSLRKILTATLFPYMKEIPSKPVERLVVTPRMIASYLLLSGAGYDFGSYRLPR